MFKYEEPKEASYKDQQKNYFHPLGDKGSREDFEYCRLPRHRSVHLMQGKDIVVQVQDPFFEILISVLSQV